MKVLQYTVYDPLSLLSLFGLETTKITCYSKIGEQGLLEDYLKDKGYTFLEPVEIDVEDDFKGFSVVLTDQHYKIDVGSHTSQLVITPYQLLPSEN